MKPTKADPAKVARSFRSAEHRDLFVAAHKAGWLWRIGGSGHVLMHSPGGRHRCIISTSAYDGGPKGTANIKAALRRGGVQV